MCISTNKRISEKYENEEVESNFKNEERNTFYFFRKL